MQSNFVSVWSHISTQNYPLKYRICSLVFCVHISSDFQLLFLIKFGEILIFLAENLAHGSQKYLTPKCHNICFNFVPHFRCRSFKNLFFFPFKTCCKILLCNSMLIVHYFWKTKILNLKNFASFWPIFLHDTLLKSLNFMFYFCIRC
jgi:hypothetical protein